MALEDIFVHSVLERSTLFTANKDVYPPEVGATPDEFFEKDLG
jgi:hypothetical protein